MRNTLILLVIVLLKYYNIQAQSFLPLFKLDTTTWSVNTVGLNGIFDSNETYYYGVIKVGSDTIIYRTDYLTDSISIRVSNDNSKAWIFLEEFNKEIMVYDITLTQIDSFKLYSYHDSQIDSSYLFVDSIYIEDGRKVILFKNENNFPIESEYAGSWKFSFIEGVGPSNFFFYGRFINIYPDYLLCKIKNESIEYSFLSNGECSIEVGVLDRKPRLNKLNVYPNPAINSVTIGLENVETIKLIDIYGQHTNVKFNQENKTIDIIELKKGIYFISAKDSEGSLFFTKFLKK